MNSITHPPPLKGLLVTEVFHSIQGETSLAGLPFIFIRFSGCNLRCSYCDTSYAFKGGTLTSVEALVEKATSYACQNILLTGGEPLLQNRSSLLSLISKLLEKNRKISIETHGEVSIEAFAEHCRIVMDIKTPDSGMNRNGFIGNLKHLKDGDEIKFVVASKADYSWAKDWTKKFRDPKSGYAINEGVEILFSAANRHVKELRPFEGLSATWLAEQILKDSLEVRLQIQLHKVLWDPQLRGV